MVPAALLATAALGTLGGCGRVVEGRAEQAVNAILPQYLGPADRWSSRVGGRPDAMLRGRLRSVHVEGDNVRLAPGLVVGKLTLDLRDVSVDRKAGTLEDVGATRFSALLGERALNDYVRRQRTDVRDLRVSLGKDARLTVRARPELLGYPTLPVEVRGTLKPRGIAGGTTLDFVPDRARLSILPIPLFVAEHVAARLNPVVDLSGLPVPILVERADVTEGTLTLTGSVPSDAILDAADAAIAAAEQRRRTTAP
ncbi:MAG TPA: DUF2993 domain-containing protein [Armatimonadaceae bacterium]|nr:DUF2993 domain-containing protein [Armatimonadaceae bacterium]